MSLMGGLRMRQILGMIKLILHDNSGGGGVFSTQDTQDPDIIPEHIEHEVEPMKEKNCACSACKSSLVYMCRKISHDVVIHLSCQTALMKSRPLLFIRVFSFTY